MLPDVNGIEVLRRFRESNNAPAIMLTALDDEFTQLVSFECKADEYVTKPFSPLILVKRVNALIKRTFPEKLDVTIGSYSFDFDRYTVFNGMEQIILTTKEIELVKVLYENKGKVVDRQQLLNQLFGEDYFALDRTIDTHVKNIRKKLDSNFISTVKGVGYKIDR